MQQVYDIIADKFRLLLELEQQAIQHENQAHTLKLQVEDTRSNIRQLMQEHGYASVEMEHHKLVIQHKKPAPLIHDKEALPARFRIPREAWDIDKAALKEALEDGEVVPGVRFSNGEDVLVIRSKR